MSKREEKSEENRELRGLLYQALAEPVGLLISSSEPERLRKRLYQLRTLAEDPELERIQIAASPFPGGQLVIVKVARVEPDETKSLPKATEALLDI